MSDDLILVDLFDNEIGSGEKLWVHQNDILHRAFSVFIISDGKMLIQRRNLNKYHSGGLWANACCSHPRVGESLEDAVERRLQEELGIKTETRELFHFVYRTKFDNALTEYEYDHVFLGNYSGEVFPHMDEVEEVKWIDIDELSQDMLKNPADYASWFIIAFPKVLEFIKENGN
jgi:isopentenyl-diphosphate delta-isomerase